MLAGEWQPERIALYDEPALDDLRLTWRLGVRAVALDATSRTVTLEGGERVTADGVVIATGARTRTLRGGEHLDGVYTLRTLADSLAIRAEFDARPGGVVVVGAGFIGAEVAATARGRGLDVTMVEMAETPLERVLGAEMGRVCAEVHADHGVDLRLGVGVEELVGAPEAAGRRPVRGGRRAAASPAGSARVRQVVLTDGTRLDADVVVVGVGVIPNTEWLEGSGLEIDNGVVCDETCLAAPGASSRSSASTAPATSCSTAASSPNAPPGKKPWTSPAPSPERHRQSVGVAIRAVRVERDSPPRAPIVRTFPDSVESGDYRER